MDLILKKSFFLILSQGLARVLGFFYTIYLAKALAIDEFGLYSAALAYFSLASVIADFGFNRFLIREVVINKERLTEILFNVTSLRLTFATILFCIFTIGLYLFDKDIFRSNLSILAIMAILPQAIALSLDAVFIALQKITFSAIATLVLSFFNCLLGVILVSQNFGSTGVISALIAAQLIYTLFLLLLLKKERVRLFSKITTNSLIKVLIGSLPYGLLGILGLIYFKIDTLMLSYMRGNFETALYSVSYKFLEAVILIPSALSAVVFPAFAKLHQGSSTDLKKYYFKLIRLMIFLGGSVLLIYLFIIPIVINILLPKYIPAIGIIQLLSFTIPFMYLHTPATQLLLSSEKYLKPVIILSLVTVFFNVICNFIFIPLYGYLAAAWITILSEALSFLIFFIFVQKKVF